MTTDAESRVNRTRRVLLVSNSSPDLTTGRLFAALAEVIATNGDKPELIFRRLPTGIGRKVGAILRSELRTARRLPGSDALIVHTPLAASLLSLVLARILRKTTVAYVWDVYFERKHDSGIGSRGWTSAILAAAERIALSRSSSVVVASTDYLPAVRRWAAKTSVVPLWPTDTPIKSKSPHVSAADEVDIGFAGQLNHLRGLEYGICELVEYWAPSAVNLHVFSSDEPSTVFAKLAAQQPRLRLVLHGHAPPDKLQKELSGFNAGWVCLSPDFALPAFPSKSLAYLCAGIPVLYTGPSLPGFEKWLTENGLGKVTRESTAVSDCFATWAKGIDSRRDLYFRSMRSVWWQE